MILDGVAVELVTIVRILLVAGKHSRDKYYCVARHSNINITLTRRHSNINITLSRDTVILILPVSYTHLRAHETPEHLV